MATYKCSKDLQGKILKEDDIVILKDLYYDVRPSWLNCQDRINNAMIFDLLNVNKITFCEKYYRYLPSNGSWPEYKENDFSAATRVVMALFELIEKDSKPVSTESTPKEYKHQEFKFNSIKPSKVYF